jgi:hypothetical protein
MKKPETQFYLELLKRRVASLRLMAKELRDCRGALIKMDLESTRQHISYQQGLCSEIRFLDQELGVLRRELAKAGGLEPEGMSESAFAKLFDAGSASQLRQILDDLEQVQRRVWRLNRVYGGVLRRSRRSIHVLINVLASYRGTYSRPPRRPACAFERQAGM